MSIDQYCSIYQVKNAGLGHIQRSNLTIWWPYEAVSHYPQGKHLLYMMEPPEIDTPGICTMSSDFINPLNLKIDEDVSLATLAKIRVRTLNSELYFNITVRIYKYSQ